MKKQEWLFSRTPVKEEYFAQLEKILNKRLPFGIKSFLQENNGSSPKNNIFSGDNGKKYVVSSILDLTELDTEYSECEAIYALKNKPQNSIFPIAADPFGNIFYINLDTQSSSVFFSEHDSDAPDIKISDSFDSFIANLASE